MRVLATCSRHVGITVRTQLGRFEKNKRGLGLRYWQLMVP